MPSPIPIQNLYYLFLYAWDRFPEGRAIELGATSGPDILDLFARVLSNGVRRLLWQGIDRGYRELVEETAAPRGRFLLADTIKRAALVRGRAVCSTDELSVDLPHNQILKATLRSLAAAEGLNRELAQELRRLNLQLAGVSDRPLSRALFRQVQLSRNTRHYDLLLRICALILDNLLPGEGQSRTRFADLLEDEVRMSTVFEAFLRNFYRAEQSIFRVSAEHIAWDAHCADPAHAVFLPRMRTDVTLRSLGRTIVMDAKYHKKTLSRFRDGPETLKSQNLYQMLTYLQHIDHNTAGAAKAEGLLLYPRVTAQDLRLDYTLAGHRVRVCTLNLDQPWTAIHQDLLTLVN